MKRKLTVYLIIGALLGAQGCAANPQNQSAGLWQKIQKLDEKFQEVFW